MGNSVYQINKGINKAIEFKGLKAQYIWVPGRRPCCIINPVCNYLYHRHQYFLLPHADRFIGYGIVSVRLQTEPHIWSTWFNEKDGETVRS